jgi:hypothetical protein
MSFGKVFRNDDRAPRMKRFVPRYLDPASRLGEILFGLIMVLTVTLGAGLTISEEPEGVRQLLFAAVGCNLAWGIIDAAMFALNAITVRSGKARLVEAVQRAPDGTAALALIQDEIEPELQELLAPEQADAFSRSVLEHLACARITKKVLTKDDFYGAVACFLLVFVSCLPAALPFLVFKHPHLALRISNFVTIALLFYVGKKWAKYTGSNPFATGAGMVAIGLVLVGLAVLLGG